MDWSSPCSLFNDRHSRLPNAVCFTQNHCCTCNGVNKADEVSQNEMLAKPRHLKICQQATGLVGDVAELHRASVPSPKNTPFKATFGAPPSASQSAAYASFRFQSGNTHQPYRFCAGNDGGRLVEVAASVVICSSSVVVTSNGFVHPNTVNELPSQSAFLCRCATVIRRRQGDCSCMRSRRCNQGQLHLEALQPIEERCNPESDQSSTTPHPDPLLGSA